MTEETRPWGKFEVLLDAPNCKVKRITINPGQAPSYQYHFKREEMWVLISGHGELKRNDLIEQVNVDSIVYISKQESHQMRNTGTEPLVFIEIQRGEYFGEDDIVRLNDDYGRA